MGLLLKLLESCIRLSFIVVLPMSGIELCEECALQLTSLCKPVEVMFGKLGLVGPDARYIDFMALLFKVLPDALSCLLYGIVRQD